MPVRGRFLRVLAPTNNYGHRSNPGKTIPVIIIAFIWLFLSVWMSSQAVKFNYEINGSVKTRDRLKMSNRALEIKLQSMMSGEGITKAAKERYGFKQPADGQVVPVLKKRPLLERIIKGLTGRARQI